MRQETGSKTPQPKCKIVSIRITSGGHNFSAHTPPASEEVVEAEEAVTLLIESSKAMLTPTVILADSTPTKELQAAGISVQTSIEDVVVVDHDTTTSALIVLPKALLSSIYERFGREVRFTTPLLLAAPASGHAARVYLSKDRGLLCVNLFNGGDRIFAELFEIKGYADVVYWLTRIGEGYDLSTYTIYIEHADKELEKLLGRYYKSIKTCE